MKNESGDPRRNIQLVYSKFLKNTKRAFCKDKGSPEVEIQDTRKYEYYGQ